MAYFKYIIQCAVLLANLNATLRINQSHPVSYVPVGLDATVADNGPYFKFKNNNNTAHIYPDNCRKYLIVGLIKK